MLQVSCTQSKIDKIQNFNTLQAAEMHFVTKLHDQWKTASKFQIKLQLKSNM